MGKLSKFISCRLRWTPYCGYAQHLPLPPLQALPAFFLPRKRGKDSNMTKELSLVQTKYVNRKKERKKEGKEGRKELTHNSSYVQFTHLRNLLSVLGKKG
jgi:hypothetical protein